jgi:catechol 2,3-dioxygenase-like lactoylglutathione lyase family enzyme
MPAITGLLETALYVDDLPRAREFYEDVFGFRAMVSDDRLCAFNVVGRDVLLLFARGKATEPAEIPGGVIPPHDGSGPLHLAFSIDRAELPKWESKLADAGIPIESRVAWPRGGESIYFRDPDGHLLELLTPGVWEIY